MKRLLVLLLIPLFFGCGNDSKKEEEKSVDQKLCECTKDIIAKYKESFELVESGKLNATVSDEKLYELAYSITTAFEKMQKNKECEELILNGQNEDSPCLVEVNNLMEKLFSYHPLIGGKDSKHKNKSGFSKEWKENFTIFCYQNAKVSMRENVAENYCDCALEKVMEKYSSGEEADKEAPNMTIKEVQALYQPCYNNAIR